MTALLVVEVSVRNYAVLTVMPAVMLLRSPLAALAQSNSYGGSLRSTPGRRSRRKLSQFRRIRHLQIHTLIQGEQAHAALKVEWCLRPLRHLQPSNPGNQPNRTLAARPTGRTNRHSAESDRDGDSGSLEGAVANFSGSPVTPPTWAGNSRAATT